MTKTVEEVRRAAFEAWYESRSGYKPRLQESGRYTEIGPALSWEGFNAALDAVEIQLPDWHSTDGSDSVIDYNEAVAAIEQTGLGLRVK